VLPAFAFEPPFKVDAITAVHMTLTVESQYLRVFKSVLFQLFGQEFGKERTAALCCNSVMMFSPLMSNKFA